MINFYDKSTTNFKNNGIANLKDMISCVVTEELNGSYELEAEYPLLATNSSLIENESILKVDAGTDNMQLFRIKRIVPNLQTIKINANHISYDLKDNNLLDVYPQKLSGAAALEWILSKTQYSHSFTTFSDITKIGTARYVNKNPIKALIGEDDNSFVNIWGGEIIRDNFTIKMLQKRGNDMGYRLSKSKNITGLEFDIDNSNIITRVIPKAFNGIKLPEICVDSPLINTYPYPKIQEVEYSNIKLKDENSTEEGYDTLEEVYDALRDAVNNDFDNNNIDKPVVSVKVNFVELSKTIEYKNFQNLETVHLGDYVTLFFENYSMKLRVIKTKYDSILGRYVEIELGNIKSTFTDSISKKIEIVKKEITEVDFPSLLSQAKSNATEQLTKALGGYVYKAQNELFIMDSDIPERAVKVWRWNLNGLGYSKNGINGPYEIAMTQDGQIVADFITTGTMNVQRIEGLSNTLKDISSSIELNDQGIKLLSESQKTLDSKISEASANFEEFKDNEYIQSISNLQNQIDGAIQFWNGAEIPTLDNYPSKNWTTENDRINHQADIYTVIEDIDGEMKQGKSYRFDKVEGTWQWIELTDNELSAVQKLAQDAQKSADKAQETADKNTKNIESVTKRTATLELHDTNITARVSTVETSTAKAQTTANNAQTSANNAQTTANEAKETANNNTTTIATLTKKTSSLELKDKEIEASVDTLKENVNDISTTNKTVSNKNSLYIEDALEENALEFRVKGKSEQKTRSGKNLYNYKDTTVVGYGITTDKDGWITITCDNTNGTDTVFRNYYTNNLNLKTGTNYNIIMEVKNVSATGDGNIFPISVYGNTEGQFISGDPFVLRTLSNNSIKQFTRLTKNSFENIRNGIRTFVSFGAGTKGSITFRLSVLEDTTVTANNFKYEAFGVSPSPDYPSEIQSIKGIENLFNYYKNFISNRYGLASVINDDGSITTIGKPAGNYIGIVGWQDITDKLENGEIYTLSQKNNNTKLYTQLRLTKTSDSSYTYISANNGPQNITINKSIYSKYEICLITTTTVNWGNDDLTITNKYMFCKGLYTASDNFVPYGNWLVEKITGNNSFNMLDETNFNFRMKGNSPNYQSFKLIEKTSNEIKVSGGGGNYTEAWIDISGLTPNTKYSLSYTIKDNTLGYNPTMKLQSNGITDANGNITIALGLGNGTTTVETNKYVTFTNIQLEKGSASTKYELYKEQNIMINLNKDNLFDKDTNITEHLFYNVSNGKQLLGSSIVWNQSDFIQTNYNQYTLYSSYKENNMSFEITQFDSSQNWLKTTQLSLTSGMYTFIKEVNTKYIKIGFRYDRGTELNIRLIEGVDSYHELCSNKDLSVRDELVVNETETFIEKKIGKIVLNGSEYYGLADSNQRIVTSSIYVPELSNVKINIVDSPTNLANALSENYIISTQSNTKPGSNTIGFSQWNNVIYIYFPADYTLAEFKSQLQANPVTIYYELATPEKIQLDKVDIPLYENINNLTLLEDLETDTSIKYLTNNVTNQMYATRSQLKIAENSIRTDINAKFKGYSTTTDMNNTIEQKITDSENAISLKVEQVDKKATDSIKEIKGSLELKIGKNENDEIVSMLNASAKEINLKSNRFSLESDKTKIKKDGTVEFTGGTIGGFELTKNEFKTNISVTRNYTQNDFNKVQQYLLGQATLTNEEIDYYDANGDGTINILDLLLIQKVILGTNSATVTGIFELNSSSSLKSLSFKDSDGKTTTSVGINGIGTKCISADTISVNDIRKKDGNPFFSSGCNLLSSIGSYITTDTLISYSGEYDLYIVIGKIASNDIGRVTAVVPSIAITQSGTSINIADNSGFVSGLFTVNSSNQVLFRHRARSGTGYIEQIFGVKL